MYYYFGLFFCLLLVRAAENLTGEDRGTGRCSAKGPHTKIKPRQLSAHPRPLALSTEYESYCSYISCWLKCPLVRVKYNTNISRADSSCLNIINKDMQLYYIFETWILTQQGHSTLQSAAVQLTARFKQHQKCRRLKLLTNISLK